MMNQSITPQITLRIKQLAAILSISKSSIWAKLDTRSRYYDPAFPKPIKIGRATCFLHAEVVEYVEARTIASRTDMRAK